MSTNSDNNRGYTLEMHNIMATQDPVWFEKYNDFIHATYTGERTLDRKTKELIQITVEAAHVDGPPSHIPPTTCHASSGLSEFHQPRTSIDHLHLPK